MKSIKKRGILICFIGIDGSGKTTLAKALVDMMEKRNINAKYVYNISKPFITKPLTIIAKLLLLHGKDMNNNYSEYRSTKSTLLKKPLLSSLYQLFLLIDYAFQVFLKVKIPLLFGKCVVCDRYLYDTIIDFGVYLDYPNKEVKTILGKYLRLFPKSDLVFFIDVQEEIAFQRKDDTPSVEYLKERRKFYLDVGKEFGINVLDGAKGLQELLLEIEKRVFQ